MYQGHLGEISNRAVWEPVFDIVDDDTGEAVDLSSATEILFEIKSPRGVGAVVQASLANGKVTLLDNYNIKVSFAAGDLSNLFPGQYRAALSFTLDDKKHDPMLAQITILQGAG